MNEARWHLAAFVGQRTVMRPRSVPDPSRRPRARSSHILTGAAWGADREYFKPENLQIARIHNISARTNGGLFCGLGQRDSGAVPGLGPATLYTSRHPADHRHDGVRQQGMAWWRLAASCLLCFTAGVAASYLVLQAATGVAAVRFYWIPIIRSHQISSWCSIDCL